MQDQRVVTLERNATQEDSGLDSTAMAPSPWPEDWEPRERLQLCGKVGVAMVAACPFPANRGTPFRILQMGDALARNGFEVHTVTYHLGDSRPTPKMQIHRTRQLSWYKEFGAGPNYSKLMVLDPLLVLKLLEVVRRHRIRILHAHHFEGALCALIVKRLVGRLQVIYDAHTTLHDELMDYREFRVPRIFKKIATDLLDSGIPRWSDHTITVSERLARFVRDRGVPESKVSCIPMSVNSDQFLFLPRDTARAELGLPERPTIVYTGSLAPFQGIEHLLRAMPIVTEQHPNCQLVIVGKDRGPYRQLSEELGLKDHVLFEGERPFTDVKRYLNAADVVVLPRDNCVGFPVKLLNYMAAGKAIVAFEGGTAEVIDHLHNGYIVKNGDDRAFGEGVAHCLGHPHQSDQLGVAARATADTFDMPAMTAKVGAIYRSLLERDGLLWAGSPAEAHA